MEVATKGLTRILQQDVWASCREDLTATSTPTTLVKGKITSVLWRNGTQDRSWGSALEGGRKSINKQKTPTPAHWRPSQTP